MVDQYHLGRVLEPEPAFAPFEGRLSIPFLTPSGVVGIDYRCIEEHDCKEHHHGKYTRAAGETTHIYNVAALHERHPAIAINEGQIDAMFVDTWVLPAIGIAGVQNWKPFYERLLQDFDRVFVIGDGDQAGRDFSNKLCEILPNAQAVVMPGGEDCNSFFLKHGPDELSAFILGKDE